MALRVGWAIVANLQVALAAGCISAPAYREYPPDEQGAIHAIAALARGPKIVGHGLELSVYYDVFEGPRAAWVVAGDRDRDADPPAGMLGVIGIDGEASPDAGGVTHAVRFATTQGGLAEALNWRAAASRREVMLQVAAEKTNLAYSWVWGQQDEKLHGVIATDGQVCLPSRCIDYGDVRAVYAGVPPAQLSAPGAPAGEYHRVTAKTFPGLLQDLKARAPAAELTFEERATGASSFALLRAVSALDRETICGVRMDGLRARDAGYACYAFAKVKKIGVWDDGKVRSAADAINAAVLAPFFVVETVAVLLGAAAAAP